MTTESLSTREVCQILRDLALGTRSIQRISRQAPPGIDSGQIRVEVDGWVLNLCQDQGTLTHCESCVAADSRSAPFADWHRYGTDPVALLSTWERAQVEGLVADPQSVEARAM